MARTLLSLLLFLSVSLAAVPRLSAQEHPPYDLLDKAARGDTAGLIGWVEKNGWTNQNDRMIKAGGVVTRTWKKAEAEGCELSLALTYDRYPGTPQVKLTISWQGKPAHSVFKELPKTLRKQLKWADVYEVYSDGKQQAAHAVENSLQVGCFEMSPGKKNWYLAYLTLDALTP